MEEEIVEDKEAEISEDEAEFLAGEAEILLFKEALRSGIEAAGIETNEDCIEWLKNSDLKELKGDRNLLALCLAFRKEKDLILRMFCTIMMCSEHPELVDKIFDLPTPAMNIFARTLERRLEKIVEEELLDIQSQAEDHE